MRKISILTFFVFFFVLTFSSSSFAQQNGSFTPVKTYTSQSTFTEVKKVDASSKWTDVNKVEQVDLNTSTPVKFSEQGTVDTGLSSGEDTYEALVFENNVKTSGGLNKSCTTTNFKTFASLVTFFVCIFRVYLIPMVMIFAFVVYVYGNSQYILNAENAEELSNQRKFILWSLFALFLMISIFGVAQLIGGVFGFEFLLPQFSTQ